MYVTKDKYGVGIVINKKEPQRCPMCGLPVSVIVEGNKPIKVCTKCGVRVK